MKVVYTAPNRAHHYFYAKALNEAGILKAFVSGFSRYSPRSGLPEIGTKLYRADFLQTLYIAALKFRLPEKITAQLAYLSKLEQDRACKKFLKGADAFLFYNGSGLSSARYARQHKVITICEVVNTHVDYQEKMMQEEYQRLQLPFIPFHTKEKARRIKEYEEADYIMLPSEFVKKSFLAYGFPEHKLLKVPYGYNTFTRKQEETATAQNTFTVLYVGSISVRKGLRYLIKAFEKLEHPHKKLVIVGPQTEPSGIGDLTIPEQVHFTGPLKGEALENAYRSADVFCLPSIEDGFGLVIGEALSYGVPVIATVNTGAPDLITDGKDGFIIPIRDEESIYDKLKLLIEDRGLLEEIKRQAIYTSQKLNGWEESKQKLVSALLNLQKKI